MTKSDRWTAALVGAAAFLLYVTRITHTPIYLNDAEIRFGLQAHAIATTGHDLAGRLLPLYFQMPPFDENVWFHPAVAYVMALFLTVLPFAEWSVRLPTAFVGAVDVALIYLLARQIFGRRRDALLAAALLAITPAHFIQSRIVADYVYPLPFVLGWAIGLLSFLRERRLWMLTASTTLLGFGVYSYIASVVMMPVYLVITLAVLWRATLLSPRTMAAAVGGFVWPVLAIPAWLAFHPRVVTDTLGRYGLGSTPNRYSSPSGRITLYWAFWDPAYLFVTGGYANVINSTRHAGAFALPLILPFVAGLLRLARRGRSIADELVLAVLFTAPVAACLTVPEPYAIDREMAVVPFGILVAVWGVRELSESRMVAWRRAGTIALALVPLHFAFFYVDYFTDYRRHSAIWFGLNHRGALEAVVTRDSESPSSRIYLPRDKDPYIAEYWGFTLVKLRRLDLLDKTEIYHDAELAPDSIAPGAIVVARRIEPVTERLTRAGLRRVATIPEIGDPPEYVVLTK